MIRGKRHSSFVMLGLASTIIVLVCAAGCEKAENKYVPPPPPKVTVSKPQQRPVTDYLELTGNTAAVESVDLRARVSGFLTSVEYKAGDIVKKGQLLFVIEPQPYEAKVDLADANVAAAKARLLRAEQEYKRQLFLIKQQATAQSEVEKWKSERDAAEAEVEQSKANLELAKIDLSYTQVKAPFQGRVGRNLVDPGNLVGAGQTTVLATIDRLNPIYAYFSLNERDLIRIMREAQGKERADVNHKEIPAFLGIADETGYPHQGKLDFVATSLDPNTGTIQMRAIFENPLLPGSRDVPNLLPGMFVRLRIPYNQRERALLVPERCLGVDQSGRFVLIVNDQDEVEQRTVKVGDSVGDLKVIEDGLKGDEWIVVNGIQFARPGAKVAPERKEAADEGSSEKAASAAPGPASSSEKP